MIFKTPSLSSFKEKENRINIIKLLILKPDAYQIHDI